MYHFCSVVPRHSGFWPTRKVDDIGQGQLPYTAHNHTVIRVIRRSSSKEVVGLNTLVDENQVHYLIELGTMLRLY